MKPEPGQIWTRGLTPDQAWRVEAVAPHSSTVYLRLMMDEKPTTAWLQWPLDRWQALVDREALQLDG